MAWNARLSLNASVRSSIPTLAARRTISVVSLCSASWRRFAIRAWCLHRRWIALRRLWLPFIFRDTSFDNRRRRRSPWAYANGSPISRRSRPEPPPCGESAAVRAPTVASALARSLTPACVSGGGGWRLRSNSIVSASDHRRAFSEKVDPTTRARKRGASCRRGRWPTPA